MGLKIKDIIKVEKEHDSLSFCKDSKVFIDTSIYLYKYLYGYKESWIHGFMYLQDLFKKYNITPVYVLDSKPPPEKSVTLQKRKTVEDRLKVTPEMMTELKEYFDSESVEYVSSPDYCDAEYYCCWLEKLEDNNCYVMSNDYDTLLYRGENIIRNVKGKWTTLSRSELLQDLNINETQFFEMCAAIGTDFNPGGVKGLGPKKALKLVKQGDTVGIDDEQMNKLRGCFYKDLNSL